MDISQLQKYAEVVLILLGILFVWLASFYVIGFVLVKILRFVFLWLSKQEWYTHLLSTTKEKIRLWFNKYQSHLESLWEYVHMVLVEPLFFAYTIFLLFNRLDYLTKYTTDNPGINFWDLLDTDMRSNTIYFWFIAIFYLWMAGKAWFRANELREGRAMMKILTAIAKKLDISEDEYKIKTKKIENDEAENNKDKFNSVL